MPRRTIQADGPHPVDVALGRRIRARRAAIGMSQDGLGRDVGVTFQQIQKYERGVSRCGASMLVAIAAALRTTSAQLLDGIGPKGAPAETPIDRLTLELSKAFGRIASEPTRHAILRLTRDLGA